MKFSAPHIALTAMLVAVAAVPVTTIALGTKRRAQVAAIVVVTGLTTLGWRLPANVAGLNLDGVTWVSPNDVLVGFLTYLTLGMYAAFKTPSNAATFERLRVALAAVAVAVNVIAI